MPENYSESWSLLPSVNIGGYGSVAYARRTHPICKSIASQLSQDLLNSVAVRGNADSLARQKRVFSKDGWKSILCSAIFTSLLYGSAWLLLDYGFTEDLASDPQTDPQPLKVVNHKPIPADYDVDSTGEVNEARFIKFDSPYAFPFSVELEAELTRMDRLTDGIIDMVSGQGVIKAGIENLYQILTSSNTDKLYARLNQLKGANKGDGVLAYDMNREDIEIIPKVMGREVESVRVIENRISALTGLPSFIIWGHTDGDGYGVASSLHLYNQRIQSLSDMFLLPVMNYILELLGFDDLYAETQDIFVETQAERVDRFNKLVTGLTQLQDIGAMTSIEVRDTVSSNCDYLILDPATETVTPPAQANPVPVTNTVQA